MPKNELQNNSMTYKPPPKIRMQRKNRNRLSTKICKKRLKIAKLPHTLKQNRKLHKFTTTEIKNTKTEFKLYTIRYELKKKRI